MRLHYAQTLHSRKACAVARYLDLPVEFVAVDLGIGAHKAPEFLRLNPNGRVPVLEDSDCVLWEANAIMAHLAIAAQSDLWPEGAAQADVLRWLSWDSEHFKPYAGTFYFERLIRPFIGLGDPDLALIEAATPPFHAAAGVLEEHLSDRDFLRGRSLSIADFAVAVSLPYADAAGIPLAPYPSIRRWHDRMLEVPAWREPFAQSRPTAAEQA